MGVLGGGWTMESGGGQGRGGWIKESVNLVSVGGWVCVCVGVLSVGLGPGLDSMSPARSRRSASHAAGTHGWLPQKVDTICTVFPRTVPPTVALWHTNHEQAVSVWCIRLLSSLSSSSHQTSIFHLSTHFFSVSLNLVRSSGCFIS